MAATRRRALDGDESERGAFAGRLKPSALTAEGLARVEAVEARCAVAVAEGVRAVRRLTDTSPDGRGPGDTEAERVRATSSVSRLKALIAELDDAIQDASTRLDLEPEAVQRAHREGLQGHRQECTQLRARLKRLTVSLADAQKHVARARRRELLAGGMDTAERKAMQSGGSMATMMMWQSREATSALERSRAMMSADLERIASVADIMNRDSDTLRKTMDGQDGVGADVATTDQALSILWRRRMTDRVLQLIGVALFVMVVLYILYRRAKWVVGFVPFL